ncbi:hypothetical protein N7G274_010203 [Stereocaulon virgatum]|uniref:Uncharacterized protein n=1 Tax=Stereocaulon virgatum TaxID=373712 RepID=A0ABR3ZVZ0_9LECA
MASSRTTRSDRDLVQANIFLSQKNTQEAIKLYTKILYTVSPGHVCALLNRALAYLCLEHPELAVVDAYRAAVSAYGMREKNIQSNKRYINVCQYILTEKVNVEKLAAWTGDDSRFIETNGVSSPLSSIVINDPSNSITFSTVSPNLPTSRKEVCRQLEIRAIYRLAFALSLCGGGARSDALGLLDDACTKYGRSKSWEMREYKELGDSILNDIFNDLDRSDSRPGNSEFTSSAVNTDDQQARQKIKAEMRSKTTMIESFNYSFDDFEPSLQVEQWQNYVVTWVQRCTTCCSAYIITPSGSPGSPSEPYLELRALQDISAGDKVLSESTVSNVTTSTPEDVVAKSALGSTDHFYCDTCATLLVVPGDSPHNYAARLPFLTSDPKPDPAGRANIPEEDDSVIDPVLFPRGEARRSSSPSGHTREAGNAAATISSDLMFCSTTHVAPSCCARCRKYHEVFGHGLCRTKVERDLRKGQLNDFRTPRPADCKIQCLQELLYLRTFVTSLTNADKTSHPLHDDDIMFAMTTPNSYQKADEAQPWSFTNNVIRPIYNISQVCASLDIDPFTTLWQTDGWMINTAMTKISMGMRISKGPRYARIYDDHANLVTEYGKHDARWNRYVTPNEPDEEKQIWIGSINPVFNTIRIADRSKDEVPNVVVVQKTALHVYAISPIKQGEALLRAADDDEEAPIPETWILDEDEVWESEEDSENENENEMEEGEIAEGEGSEEGEILE